MMDGTAFMANLGRIFFALPPNVLNRWNYPRLEYIPRQIRQHSLRFGFVVKF